MPHSTKASNSDLMNRGNSAPVLASVWAMSLAAWCCTVTGAIQHTLALRNGAALQRPRSYRPVEVPCRSQSFLCDNPPK